MIADEVHPGINTGREIGFFFNLIHRLTCILSELVKILEESGYAHGSSTIL